MKTIEFPPKNTFSSLTKRPVFEKNDIENLIKGIFEKVENEGDNALKFYAEKFDNQILETIEVSQQEIAEAISLVDEELKIAINTAKSNIEKFHQSQKEIPQQIETTEGVVCWRESRAIDKVGLYIPGGTAPLFSTVLMLAVPAQIAGCKEIILCSPPQKNGKINPIILYVANLCGVSKIFKVGGAQAIAAMSLGTETVPKVYKIFGPGNQFVTEAKIFAQKLGIAIDMPAGPSEVLVIADETANPSFVAADLLSQAEHGVDSQVVFLTTSKEILEKVKQETEAQLQDLPRKDIAEKALENSSFILLNSIEECIEFSNEYAPEHLILSIENPENILAEITNAGSIFLGNYTPESAGDYASGTNHTLPTNGNARAYSGVSLDSFVKKITIQKISEKGIQNLGKTIEKMAAEEGLFAHKNAVTLRLKNLENGI